ncbi:S-layer homology domain-containing protein [Paenibacillus sophorae]|uniref:S-layer homology domain-containing protein n=1 Tax=Paenibacillus sophorae TaxID=1333845 RepID=A0A1H8NK27_9BACL|nr:S-layer homology domain-containing protein [Paenibacillus sophorae]QWU14580.1 S-layer homology domain-containing protein [Paenibacillus sophorae]SEO29964.1 S-layer homology domain-containing protein [Paenibacillus sophorae]
MSGLNKYNYYCKGYTKKAISVLLAGAIAFGGAGTVLADSAPAGNTAVAASTPSAVRTGAFSDVNSGFWAEKHIYKLAAQEIIIGNNGKFRPGDPVTQQEAVLMALRFMKLDDQASGGTATALPTGFDVSNYYKPYVVLAFQRNVLDKTTEMAAENLKTSWGTRKATREWIAELLIRALGKTSDAQAVASEPSGFADDAKISIDKRGYINAAIDLGLTNGLSGNIFNPQGEVTRAQLATFFSRAEAHSAAVYNNTSSGIVTEVKEGKMTLYSGASNAVYSLNSGTAYFSSAAETAISLNNIQPYTKVTVIGKNGTASYVELNDPKPQVETIQGTFARLSVSSNKLWLKNADGYPEYAFDNATSFVDAGGSAIAASSISEDSIVAITRETFTGQNKILKVQVTSGVVNKTASGTLKSIDLTAKTITFTNASGTDETFKWADSALFSYQKAILVPSELKAGSAVNYKIVDNLIVSVEVTQAVERTVQGMLTDLNGSSVVYKKADGTRGVQLLAASTAIVIPGYAKPATSDLIADATYGDTVELTLNGSDQVTKIAVVGRKLEQLFGTSVVSYNFKTKLLTVMGSNNQARVYQLDENTKFINDFGNVPTLSNIASMLTENQKLNISALGQRTLSLEIVSKYEGTLASVNTSTRTLVLKTTDGRSLTLPYPPIVEMFGRTGLSITDVSVGSVVTGFLMPSQDVLTSLKVKTSQQLQLAYVDAANNKLGVKTSGGNIDIYTLAIPLTDETGQTIKLSDLKAGDYVNVSALGSSPLSIQSVKLTTGQVTAIDAAAGTLSVKDYTGAAQAFGTGGSVKIVRDNGTSTALGSLSLSERAEVRKDADGTTIVRILPVQTRYFSSYDAAAGRIVVKRDNVNDENYRFILSPNVYIHQGDTTLSVQSLKENDKIAVYLNNNVVVEIVKQ